MPTSFYANVDGHELLVIARARAASIENGHPDPITPGKDADLLRELAQRLEDIYDEFAELRAREP